MALTNVTTALGLLEKYPYVKGRGYFTDLALKFRTSTYLELARADEERLTFCADQEPQHLVVGMGSYGRNDILDWYKEAKSTLSP